MILPYILKVGIMLMGSLCFYKLFLQKQTFYKLNRFALLACLLLSFLLPVVHIPSEWSLVKTETPIGNPVSEQRSAIPLQSHFTQSDAKIEAAPASSSNKPPTITLNQAVNWVVYIYWFGVVLFALNFLLQLSTLVYRAYTSPVIRDGRFRLAEVTGNKAPCSFANTIFINPSLYDWETYSQILLHEKIHVQQRHTVDLLLAELMLIFQFFNPFAWWYRKEVEANLEFLTDENMLKDKGVEPSRYQLSLLKVSAPQYPLPLTTNYNQSLLKKRVMKMNAKKSNIHTAWKYCFLLPLFLLMMAVFNEPVAQAVAAQQTKTEPYQFAGGWTATVEKDFLFMAMENKAVPNDSITTYFSLATISGLTLGKQGDFSVIREAGTLTFSGIIENGRGTGTFRFIPSPSFAAEMKKENIVLTEREQVNFFLINVTRSYVQTLKKQGYPDIGTLNKQGYPNVTNAQISRLAEQGVGKTEKEREEKVLPPPPVSDDPVSHLINSKLTGITEEYIQSFKKAGYTDIPNGTLINFKSLGITPEYLNRFVEAGFRDIPYSTFVNFKSVGVTPEYIHSFQNSGYKDVSYDKIVNLKAAGVPPPQNGPTLNPKPEPHIVYPKGGSELESLGITKQFIKNFEKAGYTGLTSATLINFKSVGITPEYIKSFDLPGLKPPTYSDIISFKMVGITPEYIKAFQRAGKADVSYSELVNLKAAGVEPPKR